MKAQLPHLPKIASCQLGALAFFVMILTGCGNSTTSSASGSCEANTAQFIVSDGAITRVCGCTEGYGTFISSNSFNCTVDVGTTLYFYFPNITIAHQITLGILGTTQSIDSNSATREAAIVATQTGTFGLTDINTSIGGTLIVN